MTNRDRAETSEQRTRVTRAQPSVPSGRKIAGRYELLEQVGAGASALTWRARDIRLGRIVAVKLLRPALAAEPGYAQRFEREAQLAASISHPNVVDIYDVGQEDGQLYIVMQFVDGEDMKHLIEHEGRLSPERAVAVEQQILDGLGAIHRAGIIHRDIKPQNVLIGDDGIARVTDFGVAHVDTGEGLTSTGMAIGTAAYMAPEQAEGGQVSEATDIYAAGVVLYELLTGRLPFSGPSQMAIMLAHIRQPVTPPSQAAPGARIAPALDGVVVQAMAKSPSDRFRSASAMNQALAAALGDGSAAATQRLAAPLATQSRATQALPTRSRPLAAAPVSQPVAPASSPRRHSFVPASLVALLLIALLAGAGWYLTHGNPFGTSGDGNDRLPAVVDATATQVPVETPTATTEIVAPPAPTETQPVILPLDPTRTPQAPTPTPTDTPAPTETPEPTETPMPTMPPTQPMIEPPTQQNAGDNIIVPASSSTQAPQSLQSAPAHEARAAVAPTDWEGAAQDKVRGEEVILIAAGGAATLTFRLTGTPTTGDLVLSLRGATESTGGASRMTVTVNGATVTDDIAAFPAGEENLNKLSLDDLVLHIPAVNLVDGENTLEIANTSAVSGPNGMPAIVLTAGTLTMQMLAPGGAIEIVAPQPAAGGAVEAKPTKKPKSNNGNGQGNGNKGNGNDKHGN